MTEYSDLAQRVEAIPPLAEMDPQRDAYDYNTAVLNSAVLMTDFDERSAHLRTAYPQYLDLRYGPGPRHRIDYFPAARPGPLLVFLHGGFWRQRRSKENFSFLAAGPLAHDVHVAIVTYSLIPDRSLDGVVEEARAAIAWLVQQAANWDTDPDNLILAGWSGGAHLAAILLDEPGVRAGLAASGIYDLEPLQQTRYHEQLLLPPNELRRLSPIHRPLSGRELILAYGTAELPETQLQAEVFARAREGLPGSVLRVPGSNHFTLLNELASPDGRLTDAVLRLSGR